MSDEWTDPNDPALEAGDPDDAPVESASYRRARKRKRTAITLLAVFAILLGTYYYASSYWNQPANRSASSPSCTPTIPATGPLQPQHVRLNVYNATKRSGLAATTAKQLKDRGFLVGTIGNDPARRTVPQSAEVRYGPSGERAAQLVLTQVPGAAPIKDEARADASVDLVLGDAFQQLGPAPTVTGPSAPAPGGC